MQQAINPSTKAKHPNVSSLARINPRINSTTTSSLARICPSTQAVVQAQPPQLAALSSIKRSSKINKSTCVDFMVLVHQASATTATRLSSLRQQVGRQKSTADARIVLQAKPQPPVVVQDSRQPPQSHGIRDSLLEPSWSVKAIAAIVVHQAVVKNQQNKLSYTSNNIVVHQVVVKNQLKHKPEPSSGRQKSTIE
jgi:hypothetical protein